MSSSMLPYITRDVATEPPTTIVIVPCGGQPPELSNKDEAVFAVTEDCVEPTKGWINREGKPLLTVCFMHSFGKCVGRTNSNPATCFQIHIKANVLNALRKHYTNPTRRFFTRTVKALLSPELRQLLCMRAHKELKVQYLEYRVSDVFPSTGLLQYEAAYRRWLFSDDTNADHAGTITVLQCLHFSMTGSCTCGTDCPYIHADLKKAQVRDPMLARALRDVSDVTQGLPAVSLRVPKSLQPGQPQSFSPADGAYAALTDGTYPQNGMPSDPARNFTKVPVFTLVRGEGEAGGRLVPLQMHQHESGAAPAGGHPNGPHQTHRVSFFTPEEPVAEMPSTKAVSSSIKNEKVSSDGKSGGGWVSSSNEGVSSSNNHTGSSGSGSD
ncbi:hypothetical protein NESM_000005700 [Novymonas esmeraldas]|uniref:C3H1-type domain-containing protein n=1 Tax=Novymonas esmeraldas TaxID=1808958 RepID=A0AAW0F179_9TRYP